VFAHPGVQVDKGMLDFVKGKIAAGAEPWKSALAAAGGSRYGSTSYNPGPIANVICGPYSNPNIGCGTELADAQAAYTHALLWYYTGNQASAQKAIQIMNAWSKVITQHSDSNAILQSAWVGSSWPRAAEIIRYSNAGWADADIAQFSTMLKTAYLPYLVHGAPIQNGNWELTAIDALSGIAVFLEDQALFEQALSMWRARLPAYVYLTSDGPTPVLPPGGAVTQSGLTAFWFNQTMLVDGLSQETCRDLTHTQYGLAAIVNTAETARIQGIDLYTEQAKRITAGLEFHAKFETGAPAPSWLCGGVLGRVTPPQPTWEVGYNAYANRLGMALPNTQALVAKIRPTGVGFHMVWESLTHAEIGNAGIQ
jgi:hypothetical protein